MTDEQLAVLERFMDAKIKLAIRMARDNYHPRGIEKARAQLDELRARLREAFTDGQG